GSRCIRGDEIRPAGISIGSKRADATRSVLWMIEDVVELRTELKGFSFRDPCRLHQTHVEIVLTGRPLRVSTECSYSRYVSSGADHVLRIGNVVRHRWVNRCVVSVGIHVSDYEVLSIGNRHCSYSAPSVRIHVRAIDRGSSNTISIHTVRHSEWDAGFE